MEILYKGKKVGDGKWIEGFPILYRAGQIGIAQIHTTTRIVSVEDDEYFDIKDLYCPKVIPETVGQYAGCTDKNEKKIFVGDICRVCLDPEICIGDVEYLPPIASFIIKLDGGENMVTFLDYGIAHRKLGNKVWIEVIGNIHDKI